MTQAKNVKNPFLEEKTEPTWEEMYTKADVIKLLSDIEQQIAEGKADMFDTEGFTDLALSFRHTEKYHWNLAKQDDLNIISQFKDGLK